MRISAMTIGILLSFAPAHAQWLDYPTPGTPRTKDGKANLAARAPRASDGRPDLSGVWQVDPPAPGEVERMLGGDLSGDVVPGDDPRTFSRYFFDILADFKPEEEPMKPAAAEVFRNSLQKHIIDSSETHCLPMGIPRASLLTAPFQIVQTPGMLVIMHEADNTHRQIYTDGRKLPEDPQPAWLGYSAGRWESGTLVVETAGFNDKTMLDKIGHPRSESTHMTERFHRIDFGHLDVEISIDDPQNYTRSFTIKVRNHLLPDTGLLETICENEKDVRHLGIQ